MSTINVLDASGATVAIEKPLAPGRAADSASRPVALSQEDVALIVAGNASLSALAAAAADTTTESPVAPHQPCDMVSFTPTLDTAAYAAGDVLFATAALTLARANDKCVALMSLTGIDKSKNKPAMTLFFYQTNVTSAAANAANALSDADAVNCLGYHRILAADWIDLANNSFCCFKSINLILKPATGTTTVYVVGILDAGTPTFAVGDLILKLGVPQA